MPSGAGVRTASGLRILIASEIHIVKKRQRYTQTSYQVGTRGAEALVTEPGSVGLVTIEVDWT